MQISVRASLSSAATSTVHGAVATYKDRGSPTGDSSVYLLESVVVFDVNPDWLVGSSGSSRASLIS